MKNTSDSAAAAASRMRHIGAIRRESADLRGTPLVPGPSGCPATGPRNWAELRVGSGAGVWTGGTAVAVGLIVGSGAVTVVRGIAEGVGGTGAPVGTGLVVGVRAGVGVGERAAVEAGSADIAAGAPVGTGALAADARARD